MLSSCVREGLEYAVGGIGVCSGVGVVVLTYRVSLPPSPDGCSVRPARLVPPPPGPQTDDPRPCGSSFGSLLVGMPNNASRYPVYLHLSSNPDPALKPTTLFRGTAFNPVVGVPLAIEVLNIQQISEPATTSSPQKLLGPQYLG